MGGKVILSKKMQKIFRKFESSKARPVLILEFFPWSHLKDLSGKWWGTYVSKEIFEKVVAQTPSSSKKFLKIFEKCEKI